MRDEFVTAYCSECKTNSIFRYLDCDSCKAVGAECIYVCVECGEELPKDSELYGEGKLEANGWTAEKNIATEIVDEFEELLDEKNIDIPSDDREGDESEARIYGCEYANLVDKIAEMLISNKKRLGAI